MDRPRGLSDFAPSEPGEPDVWRELLPDLERYVGRGRSDGNRTTAVLSDARDIKNIHALRVFSDTGFREPSTAGYLFESLVPKSLELAGGSHWHDQRGFITSTLGLFAHAPHDFASYCLCGTWMSSLVRHNEDPRLSVTRDSVEVDFFPPKSSHIDLGPAGRYPLTGIVWKYKPGRSWDDPDKVREGTQLARITVKRTVRSPVFRRHTEYIYCRAIRDDDMPTLEDTRAPAATDIHELRLDELRTTPFVGLQKATGLTSFRGDARYTSLALELDPITGRVVSIRAAQACLASMLAWMPVEHRALRDIITGKATW